jgi:hypothetical protein
MEGASSLLSGAKARRRSVMDSASVSLAGIALSPKSEANAHVHIHRKPGSPAVVEEPVDVAALASSTLEALENHMSDKILTLMNRATEDKAESPPQDALQGLSATNARQPSEVVASVREISFYPRRLNLTAWVPRRSLSGCGGALDTTRS